MFTMGTVKVSIWELFLGRQAIACCWNGQAKILFQKHDGPCCCYYFVSVKPKASMMVFSRFMDSTAKRW